MSEDVRSGVLVPDWVRKQLEARWLEVDIFKACQSHTVAPSSLIVSQEFA